MDVSTEIPAQIRPETPVEEPRDRSFIANVGPWIAVWLLLQALSWGLGIPQARLSRAVEAGAAEVERRSVGEISDDDVRESIATQRETLGFFEALQFVGDFVLGPLGLIFRSLAAGVLFAGAAAASGRSIGFDRGLEDCARAQGFWVVGLAVQVFLTMMTGRPEVETSATLLLPSEPQQAAVWLTLAQFDLFAIAGWAFMARAAWVRRQTSLTAAIAIVVVLGLFEATLVSSAALTMGGWQRLTLIPESTA